jgi:predicted RNA methylase
MLECVDVTSADTVVDLGCGNGQIVVIAAAKYGARGVGIERDPDLVAIARRNVTRNGVGHLVGIQEGDVLRMRWTPTRKVVTLYLDASLLSDLRLVLERLPAGSRIVSHQHAVPGWLTAKPIKAGQHELYRYRVAEVTRKQKFCTSEGCTYRDVTTKVVKGF